MQLTAHQIGLLLEGTVEGNPEVTVDKLSKIEEAQAGSLSFLANTRYEQYLYSSGASVIIVNEDFVPAQPVRSTLIKVKNAYSAFSVLLEKYDEMLKSNLAGIEDLSYIHPSAQIGKDVYIGAFAYIGANTIIGDGSRIYPNVYVANNVKLGEKVTLYAGVKVYFNCEIGDGSIIHSGAVIGSDGFGFVPNGEGVYKKVAQIGNVVIEQNVEVGANTTIDRATMGSTFIRKGVKLDNLIQVAHNVDIGANTVIAAQTGISGSTKIGENCVIAGQVGIVGHISIAKGSNIGAKSGVNNSIIEEGQSWNGWPLTSYRESLKVQVVSRRLPELEKKINQLERIIQELTKDPQ